MAISAISVTPERQAVVDFSNVYFASEDAVLTKSGSTLSAKTPELLVKNRLGVQQGTVYETYAKTKLVDTGKMPQQNLLVYQDMTQPLNDLQAGRIEMVWLDLLPAREYVAAGGVQIV